MAYEIMAYFFFALVIALLLFILKEISGLKTKVTGISENMDLIKKNCVIFNISKYISKQRNLK